MFGLPTGRVLRTAGPPPPASLLLHSTHSPTNDFGLKCTMVCSSNVDEDIKNIIFGELLALKVFPNLLNAFFVFGLQSNKI